MVTPTGGSFAAVPPGSETPRFDSPQLEQGWVRESVGVFCRARRGILDLLGPRTPELLKGVFSSDTESLETGTGQPSCILTPRGRLLAFVALLRLGSGAWRLLSRDPLPAALIQTLGRYAMLSDVEVRDRTSDFTMLSVEGSRARALLGEALAGALGAGDGLPPLRRGASEPFRLVEAEARGTSLAVLSWGETPEGGWDLWVPRPSAPAVWDRLVEGARALGGGPVGSEAAEVLRIEAGVPRAGLDFDAEAFPADLGLEHALAFDKCYVGQEVVARMRTYGQANRRLVGVTFQGEGRLPAPQEGALPLRAGGEEAGSLTSWGWSDRLSAGVGLAMARRRHWDAAVAEVAGPAGPIPVRLVPLPIVSLPIVPQPSSPDGPPI